MSECVLDRAGGVSAGFVRGTVRISELSADGISERVYIRVYVCVSDNFFGDGARAGFDAMESGGVFWDRGIIAGDHCSADIIISGDLETRLAAV